jgi:hypothetical protein
MAGGFAANTRQKIIVQPALVKPAAAGITELQIRRTGLLARIYLKINALGAGAVGAANPLGWSSAIRRVRLVANSGLELFSVTGPGYTYMLQHMLESQYAAATPQNDGALAVDVAAAKELDMVIPIAVSMMDFTGLVLVQSEQILVTLQIDWETDANVGGAGFSYTATATPYVEFFSIPLDPADAPDLSRAHVILEESRAIGGAGQFIYEPLRRPTYLQLAHGSGFGVAGADNFTTARLRVEQSNYLFDGDVNALNMLWNFHHGYARVPGVWIYDWMASSGLGNYGGARDRVNTATITSFESEFNAVAAGTLTTIRRMLVDLAR